MKVFAWLLCIAVAIAVLAFLWSASRHRAEAAERIISKPDADRMFATSRAEWEAQAPLMTHPLGWKMGVLRNSGGVGVAAFDRKTGVGLTVQPFYRDDDPRAPQMILVGSWYPIGMIPTTPGFEEDLEKAARADLGPDYHVTARRTKLPEPPMEGFELVIFRATK